MLRYILKSIKKYYDYFIFMVLGIFVIMTIFPLGVSSLMKIKVTVQGDISKYGRGEYDLLVRNENSITKLEKELKLIDESYALNGKGGISMSQYEAIKGIKGIEAAAPIANLGFYPSIANYLGITTNAEESNKFDITYNTWDGPNRYKVEEFSAYQIAGKDFIDDLGKYNEELDKEKNMYKYLPYAAGNNVLGVNGMMDVYKNKLQKLKTVYIKVPQTYSMLVAIDPEQENKVFISKFSTPGKSLKNKAATVKQIENIPDVQQKVHSKVNKIPVVINSEAPLRLEANIKIKKLNEAEEPLRNIFEKANVGKMGAIDPNIKDSSEKAKSIMEQLDKYTDKEEIKAAVNFNTLMKPFMSVNVVDAKALGTSYSTESFSKKNMNLAVGTDHFIMDDLNYVGDKTMLSPKAIDQQANGVLNFMNKRKIGTTIEDINNGSSQELPITFVVVDEIEMVDRTGLEYEDKLNGSPLGIYGGDSIKQLEDANGKKVNWTIDQTIDPTSLGKVMPNGYTVIDAAPLLKGDNPIDAIRVKVEGIAEYNNAAKEKIENVATAIYNKTGLKVDFVAGSSTTKTVGQIGGIDGANGLGKIEKRWVTLGTDSLVTTSWNTAAFILMIAFIVCGCLFVINRINSYMILRKREMNTLECTGWDKKYIAFVITGENILAYIIATIFAVVVLLKMNINKSIIISSVIIIFFIIILVSYFYTLKHKDRDKKKGYKSLSFTMIKLVLSDIVRNKNRYILLMTQLILTATLGLFTLMSFNATRQSVNYTALGSQVNMSTSSIVKPIIMGSIILIVFTTFDRFTSLMLERKQEIILLKTLGWSNKKISGLMYGSLIMIGVIVTAITLGITSLIGFVFYTSIPIKAIHMAGIALIILAICIIGGVYPIVKCLRKNVLKYNGNDR